MGDGETQNNGISYVQIGEIVIVIISIIGSMIGK